MKYKIVSVRDRVAGCFGVPNFVVSSGAAIRAFGDEINRADSKNHFYMHPDDFDLFELGEFDDERCVFDLVGSPQQLCLGRDLKVRSQAE